VQCFFYSCIKGVNKKKGKQKEKGIKNCFFFIKNSKFYELIH